MTTGKEQRRLAAVMFCDIKGYTALVQKDEAMALQKVAKFRRVLEEHTQAHHGEVIEFYGDGSLSVYPSIIEAVRCAIRMQEEYLSGDRVSVRVGVHFGDIVFRDGTVYGDGVNLAARIEAKGIPGAILVSDKVEKELRNHPSVSTISLGFFDLKNVEEPVEIHAVDHPSVTLPDKEIGKIRRKKRLRTIQRVVIGILVLSLLAFLWQTFRSNLFKANERNKTYNIFEEKIAVQQFQNNTFRDSLNLIGDLAGDFLSRELIRTEKANVIAYRTRSELENSGILRASAPGNSVTRPAVFLITGSYRLTGSQRDSILFSASVQNTRTGEMIHAFDDQAAPVEAPFEGLEKLNNRVMGYWESKDQNLTVPPDYEAYKAFLKARDAWFSNDSIAIAQLQKAIRLDSTFTDPYFYLFTRYFDLGAYPEAGQVLAKLKGLSATFSNRQKQQVRQMEADLAGQNVRAYRLFMDEYAQNPEDIFVNGAAMAYAMEYVNAPEKAIEVFERIPLDRFTDYAACAYCLERLHTAQMAYIKLGRYRKAEKVIEAFPDRMDYQKFFIGQARYFVLQEDTAAITSLASNMLDSGLDPSYIPILHFVTAREFRLLGDDRMTGYYADLALRSLPSELYYLRGEILALKGENDAAYRETQKLLEQYPDYQSAIAWLGILAARLGKAEVAQEQVDRLDTFDQPYTFGLAPYQQAAIYAQLGEKARALEKIGAAIDAGCKFLFLNRFETDPNLALLHDDPAFQDLVHPLE